MKKYAVLIARYTFWLVFTEVLLHFVYISSLRFEPGLINRMDLWTLSGLGYSYGQFFCLKYVIFYGITRPIVMSDGIEVIEMKQWHC